MEFFQKGFFGVKLDPDVLLAAQYWHKRPRSDASASYEHRQGSLKSPWEAAIFNALLTRDSHRVFIRVFNALITRFVSYGGSPRY